MVNTKILLIIFGIIFIIGLFIYVISPSDTCQVYGVVINSSIAVIYDECYYDCSPYNIREKTYDVYYLNNTYICSPTEIIDNE